MNIRIAKKEDAPFLLNIYSHYVTNTAITFEYSVPSLSEFTKRITDTLKKYPYIVCEENDKIIGYAYASTFKPRQAYSWAVETSIYIEESCHKRGIGRALYEKLEEILKKMNVVNMNACITFPEIEDEYLTKNSYYFHQKMGFNLVGKFTKIGYKFDRWYNMIWMEKHIGEHKDKMDEVIPFPSLYL